MSDIWNDKRRSGTEISEALEKRKQGVLQLLSTIPTEDVSREGLLETPRRVSNMYEELFAGYEMDYHKILSKQFDVGSGQPSVIEVKDIQFYSMCEHHIMPFFGKISIRYIPFYGGKVVGLSKLARLVECFSRRLQIQERLGKQIADAIGECLNPQWVEVVIDAEHTCMTARGVNKPGSTTKTIYQWNAANQQPQEEIVQ